MTTMKHRLLFILSAVCLTTAQMSAQTTGAPVEYTLEDCLRIASEKNLDILGAQAQLQSQTANLTAAFGSYLPSIGASFGYQRRLNIDGGQQVNVLGFAPPPNNYSLSAIANYTIFDGFQRESQFSNAEKTIAAQEIGIKRIEAQIRWNISQQYIAVLRAAQIVKIRQENIKIGRNELDRIKARFEAGVAPISAVYSQEADLGQRELLAVQAENQLNIAQAQLLTIMGLDPSGEATFSEKSIPSTIQNEEIQLFETKIGSLKDAVQRSLAQRIDITDVHARKDAAQTQVASAKSGYMPTITANGGWSWSNAQFQDFELFGQSFLGLNVRVPIFDNFTTNANIERAKLGVTQLSFEEKQIEQTIRSQVQQAFLNISAAKKQIEISERSLKSAEMNYESAKERFAVGAGSITDYLLANSQVVTAKIDRISAIYTYFESKMQMEFALGELR